ncbi:FUSC family protein [Glaciimonas soli]|uniref:FUSC family protein n=1 Tax=Glaciimonas soli TaxID=2590999 RepID=A0A843YLB9_9BURK|nr:FUSC family protein [Glaciimonas soli]MQR00659.1 FUSC family protein [Glaciimonas soli]
MEFHIVSLRKNALVYIIKIITGSLILWFGLRALGIADPYWAMVSLIIVTEPDVKIAKANFNARLINTINGCIVAGLALLILGPGLVSILIALTISVLIAMLLEGYPSNWRLGPATVVIVMSAAVSGNGLSQELHFGLLRVGEVLAGSAVALLQSLAYSYIFRRQT